MPLGMEEASVQETLFDGDPAPPDTKGTDPTQFLAHVYCRQTAGWMKMLLVQVDLGPGHIVLDGNPAPLRKGYSSPPFFWPMSIVATVAYLSYC